MFDKFRMVKFVFCQFDQRSDDILLDAMSSRRSQNKSARHQRAAAMSSAISKQSFIFQLFRVFQAEHSLCSKQNILCVRSRTLLVFEAEHSVCSKQNIPCAPNKTFLVLHAEHSLCSKQNIPCVRSMTFLAFEARHSMCSKQNIPFVRSRTLLVVEARQSLYLSLIHI